MMGRFRPYIRTFRMLAVEITCDYCVAAGDRAAGEPRRTITSSWPLAGRLLGQAVTTARSHIKNPHREYIAAGQANPPGIRPMLRRPLIVLVITISTRDDVYELLRRRLGR